MINVTSKRMSQVYAQPGAVKKLCTALLEEGPLRFMRIA